MFLEASKKQSVLPHTLPKEHLPTQKIWGAVLRVALFAVRELALKGVCDVGTGAVINDKGIAEGVYVIEVLCLVPLFSGGPKLGRCTHDRCSCMGVGVEALCVLWRSEESGV